MFRMEYEVAFVITDSSVTQSEMQSRMEMSEGSNIAKMMIIIIMVIIIQEGYNLAFIYNTSLSSVDCARGMAHVAANMGDYLVRGYERTQNSEMPLFREVTFYI